MSLISTIIILHVALLADCHVYPWDTIWLDWPKEARKVCILIQYGQDPVSCLEGLGSTDTPSLDNECIDKAPQLGSQHSDTVLVSEVMCQSPSVKTMDFKSGPQKMWGH